MTIHIFNPESDYALASFSPGYTPPAEILQLRARMALTPAAWAIPGDAILMLDEKAELHADKSMLDTKGLRLISLADIRGFLDDNPEATIRPWGWNPMLCHQLRLAGVDDAHLPSDEEMAEIRRLSHRRTAAEFNRLLNAQLCKSTELARHISPEAIEFTDSDEAMQWEAANHPAFFKAPWSSSGRGVLFTDTLDAESRIRPWIAGIIRRQGSVMAESAAQKVIDFATEWEADTDADGEVSLKFLGVSLFEASFRGKYHSNRHAPQRELMQSIRRAAPDFGHEFISAQRDALKSIIESSPAGSRYHGFIGIDMLADSDGRIRGGIELNFRRTMGIPPIEILIIGRGNVAAHLEKAFQSKAIPAICCNPHEECFPQAETYIIAVKDDAIAEVARRLQPSPGSIVAHTSGSVGIEALAGNLPPASHCGVFYPLQTFSHDVEMNYADIPFLIEGSDAAATSRLMHLAKLLSLNVAEADSTLRAHYHLAAVIACNFANHMCTLASQYLNARHLDFRMLLPLLNQTIAKLSVTTPALAQTGPAVRGDRKVIAKHLAALKDFPDMAALYKLESESIMNTHLNTHLPNE